MKILILSNENVFPVLEFAVERLGIDVTYNPDEEYDRGVSFMYLKKITKEMLNKPWINFHPAPLPKYKGRNLCYHAIMNDEKQFGASVHYVDENFDTGEIIATHYFPILEKDTAKSVSFKAMMTSYSLLEEYLPRFAGGEVFKTFQNTGGTYYKKEPISDFIEIPELKKMVRAITYGTFYPKINIGGVIYKIVREE